MKRRVILSSAVAVAGVLSVAGPPALADPLVLVADCPASPAEGSPPICRGRAVVRCATSRFDGLQPECDAQVVVIEAAGHKSWADMPLPHGHPWVVEVPEVFQDYLFDRVRVRFGRPGVSFWIDTQEKPQEPCPRCNGGS